MLNQPTSSPALRERKGDIALLAEHFLRRSARALNRRGLRLTPEHVSQLERYNWPGNVRELQNVIERATITASAGNLRFDLSSGRDRSDRPTAGGVPRVQAAEAIRSAAEMKQLERDNIAAALRHAGGKIYGSDGAARLLGMKPTTLLSRLVRLGLKPTRHAPSG
jgi:transcriptional regulator with GAF, ATPase, and Fis domain